MSCSSIFNLMVRSDWLISSKWKECQIITLNSIVITSLLLGVIKGCWRWRILEGMLHIWRLFNQRWIYTLFHLSQKKNFLSNLQIYRLTLAQDTRSTSSQDPAGLLLPGCVVLPDLAWTYFKYSFACWYLTPVVEKNCCIGYSKSLFHCSD